MPFKSENQRRYLWAKHPEIARRWSKEYGSKSMQPINKQPPWMKGRGKNEEQQTDPRKEARKRVAAKRLALMKAKGK